MATRTEQQMLAGCFTLGACVWGLGGIIPLLMGKVSGSTYLIVTFLGLAGVVYFAVFGGKSQASADRLKRRPAQGNAAAILQRYPYLAKAEALDHALEYYQWRSYPLGRDRENDLLAFHMALHISALWERHRRGFSIRDRAGNIKALELLPDEGWIVERTTNDDGSESVVVAGDATLRNASSSFEDVTVRMGEREGIKLICPITTKQEVEQAHAIGLEFYDRTWLQLHALVLEDGRWNTPGSKNMTRGEVPLLKIRMRELTFRTERPNPLAPPSTEKGDAQFGWPEEWS